jgi:hypothetical protein
MPVLPGNFCGKNPCSKLAAPAKQAIRMTGNLPERTTTPDVHVAFKIPYVHKFITILCMQEAKVIQNHDKETHRNTG